MSSDEPLSLVPPETVADALQSLSANHLLLSKSGAPKAVLNALHLNIEQLKLEVSESLASQQPRPPLGGPDGNAEMDFQRLGPSSTFPRGEVAGNDGDDLANRNKPMSGRRLYSGAVLKLQRGGGGFSAVWKLRWIRVEKGWFKCFRSGERPQTKGKLGEGGSNGEANNEEENPQVIFPLTNRGIEIEENLPLAFRLKFKAVHPLTITCTDIFGSKRSMTFDFSTDDQQRAWIEAIKKGLVGPLPLDASAAASADPSSVASAAPNLQSSLFRAARDADLPTLRSLLESRGKNPNAKNLHGMSPLAYAVVTCVRSAGDASKGSVPAVPVPRAFQCVAYLLARGANPTATVNDKGEDAFGLARRLAGDYPRAARVLENMMDSTKYEVDGGRYADGVSTGNEGVVWIVPEKEAKLKSRLELDLKGMLVDDAVTKGGSSTPVLGTGKAAQHFQNVAKEHDPSDGTYRKVRMLYTSKKLAPIDLGHRKLTNSGLSDGEGGRRHTTQTPTSGAHAKADPDFTPAALWPEHHRLEHNNMPLKSPSDARGYIARKLEKDASNPLVQFYRSELGDATTPAKGETELSAEEMRALKATKTSAAKGGRRPSSAPAGRRESKTAQEKIDDATRYLPGHWNVDMPKFGPYSRIMAMTPSVDRVGDGEFRGTRTQHVRGYSDGSHPQKFLDRRRPQSAGHDRYTKWATSQPSSLFNPVMNTGGGAGRASQQRRPQSAGNLRSRPHSAQSAGGAATRGRSPSPSAGPRYLRQTSNPNAADTRWTAAGTAKRNLHTASNLRGGSPGGGGGRRRPASAPATRRHRDRVFDPAIGAQIGVSAVPPARKGAYNISGQWFGEGDVPLSQNWGGETFPERYRKEIEAKSAYGRQDPSQQRVARKETLPTFGVRKTSGTEMFRHQYDGAYAAGRTGFLHDQPGGNVTVAGSAAAAALSKKRNGNKPLRQIIPNKVAVRLISQWHALGGMNISRDHKHVDDPEGLGNNQPEIEHTEQHGTVSYDPVSDVIEAFRMLAKKDGGLAAGVDGGDMISTTTLRRCLTNEGEKLSIREIDKLVADADHNRTGVVNYKMYCYTMGKLRLPHLPKGCMFTAEDDIVMKVQRARIAKEKAVKARNAELKEMGLG